MPSAIGLEIAPVLFIASSALEILAFSTLILSALIASSASDLPTSEMASFALSMAEVMALPTRSFSIALYPIDWSSVLSLLSSALSFGMSAALSAAEATSRILSIFDVNLRAASVDPIRAPPRVPTGPASSVPPNAPPATPPPRPLSVLRYRTLPNASGVKLSGSSRIEKSRFAERSLENERCVSIMYFTISSSLLPMAIMFLMSIGRSSAPIRILAAIPCTISLGMFRMSKKEPAASPIGESATALVTSLTPGMELPIPIPVFTVSSIATPNFLASSSCG